MKWYKNASATTKLMLPFGMMAALLAFVGYQGISASSDQNENVEKLFKRDWKGTVAALNTTNKLLSIGRDVRQAILDTDHARREQCRLRVDESFSAIADLLTVVESTLATAEGKATVAKIKEDIPNYRSIIAEEMRFALAGDTKNAIASMLKAQPVGEKIRTEVAFIVDTKNKLGQQSYDDSDATFHSTRTRLIIVISIAVIGALALGVFIARLISRPLAQSVRVLQQVADGDLTKSLEVDSKDEVGQMAKALNNAIDAMRTALSEVRASSEGVATAAEQLASSSQELSSGTQEQASSQEETSATLEQITTTVKQNADSAKQANQLAAGARESAEKGGEVVGAAVAAMAEINAASKRIADIITTIDEIAFQTNLLALNAAVEAARAGEQGRGFAVVASEVRSLAQRSATAAKEIKTLIQDSVRKVENGAELVNKSGHTLHEIVASVKRVTDIVAEISAASQEQATGIEQVGKAMLQMDQVTQTNSAQTEELSSTAQTLASHATEMQAMVGRFVLESGRRPAVRSSSPAHTKRAKRTDPHSLQALSHNTARETKPVEVSFEEF